MKWFLGMMIMNLLMGRGRRGMGGMSRRGGVGMGGMGMGRRGMGGMGMGRRRGMGYGGGRRGSSMGMLVVVGIVIVGFLVFSNAL